MDMIMIDIGMNLLLSSLQLQVPVGSFSLRSFASHHSYDILLVLT